MNIRKRLLTTYAGEKTRYQKLVHRLCLVGSLPLPHSCPTTATTTNRSPLLTMAPAQNTIRYRLPERVRHSSSIVAPFCSLSVRSSTFTSSCARTTVCLTLHVSGRCVPPLSLHFLLLAAFETVCPTACTSPVCLCVGRCIEHGQPLVLASEAWKMPDTHTNISGAVRLYCLSCLSFSLSLNTVRLDGCKSALVVYIGPMCAYIAP